MMNILERMKLFCTLTCKGCTYVYIIFLVLEEIKLLKNIENFLLLGAFHQ